MEHIKVSCLYAAILAHGLIVSCQNVTEPADNPDLTTSSPPDVTSSSDVNMTTTQESIASSSTSAGFEVRVEQQSTSSTSAGFEVRIEQQSTSEHHVTQHPTYPTPHEDKHTTHTHPDESHKNATQSPHDVHVTHHAMGTPYEPDVDAATGDEEGNGGSWEVSIIVVLALLSGMLAFVFFMIIKDRARTGRTNLKDRKLPVIGDDHGFKPLKEVTEEKEPKLTHVEKRNSQRFSYHGDPEDAIPLLELHMRDGEPPLLNANVESQDTEPQETSLKPKPLLDVYGDGNTSMSPGKSKEKVSEEA